MNRPDDLIDTTEMYLRSVLELEEEGMTPLRARIAERLGQSVPTVSQTVARMQRDGLLNVTGDRRIQLTPHGREVATRVMRKHRLAECLLADVLGLDWHLVHDEACRWEHLAELGDDEHDDGPGGVMALTQIPEAAGSVVVRRIGEPIQSDTDLLTRLRRAGLRPNAVMPITRVGDRVLIGAGSQVVELDQTTAAHVFVTTA